MQNSWCRGYQCQCGSASESCHLQRSTSRRKTVHTNIPTPVWRHTAVSRSTPLYSTVSTCVYTMRCKIRTTYVTLNHGNYESHLFISLNAQTMCRVMPPIAWATRCWNATHVNPSPCFQPRPSVKSRTIQRMTILFPTPGNP